MQPWKEIAEEMMKEIDLKKYQQRNDSNALMLAVRYKKCSTCCLEKLFSVFPRSIEFK